MKIMIYETAAEATLQAATLILEAIKANPRTTLGLATGGTPVPLYKELIKARQAGADFSGVRTFNLDEYYGLAPEHPQSYRAFMNANLFAHLNIDLANTLVPDGLTRDVDAHCAEYEALIKTAGGIDIQLLGIGSNGHIGFNEPGSSLASRTRLVTLTQQTVSDNARFFAHTDEVPRHAISMGVGTIMEAKRCLMLAFGSQKAQAIKATIEGGISQFTPASALQMHPNTTILMDAAAASELQLKEYYQWVVANAPL